MTKRCSECHLHHWVSHNGATVLRNARKAAGLLCECWLLMLMVGQNLRLAAGQVEMQRVPEKVTLPQTMPRMSVSESQHRAQGADNHRTNPGSIS